MDTIRAVFDALFAAAESAGDFDESKWIDLMARPPSESGHPTHEST
jgi:hypothetical protein